MTLKPTMLAIFLPMIFSFTSCEAPFFKLVSSSFAKEYCSCIFVVEQSPQYCKSYAMQIVSVSSFSVDQENKLVKASALGLDSVATFKGKKEGCSLN